MQPPRIPENEEARLRTLAEYEVLDSASEASFDSITTLAAQILQVPIALVSIVDDNRQWFKSRYGLSVPETPRDVSFCGHVVAEASALIVEDAFLDERFADNPLVQGEPRVRFYAGLPLLTPDGFVLGTLCAIDHKPRALGAQQIEALSILARQVISLLELRRKERLLQDKIRELEQSKAKWEALFYSMDEGVVLQEGEGQIISCNPASELILGLSREQMTGRTSIDPMWRCVREDGEPFPGSEHPAMVTLRTGEPLSNVVMGVHKPGGELTWISINSRPIMVEGILARSVVTTFRDITEQRAAAARAERLSRQERLVTTGTLAAGVGHEINNPLMYIYSNIEFSLEELNSMAGGSQSERVRELISVLGDAKEGVERIRKIVRGLKSLAREKEAPAALALAPIVEVSINMALHDLRNKATVINESTPVPLVLADESGLTQVLVNLLVNAGQAFESNDPQRHHVLIRTSQSPRGVTLTVTDNGPGIAPDVLPRIFDPFFTTKSPGEGTGLGLSISHSIVTGFGGELTCETTLGSGTTFSVLLPLAEETPTKSPFLAPRGKILIIDDDLSALRAVGRLLRAEYEVILLSDPREALRRLSSGEGFDVIFCDLMMPHLSGMELFRLVQKSDPKLADSFVFMTGGIVDSAERFLAEVPNERLEKPFSMQSLRDITKRLISQRHR